MKKYLSFMAFVFMAAIVFAQTGYEQKTSPDGKFTYLTVPRDPLGVRIYKLSNGLTVMLSVNKSEPRIQTLIATKAGSKNDPADNTGLAHYLEHMLFKGTDKFGSKDWPKEKEQLDKIDALYEQYNKTTDEAKRKKIYREIDSLSGVASKYAIANEYDKMLSTIGATGTNAFTSLEQTVYVNDIPQNQVANWLSIEGERFRNPILRLFHTELEAVYEEKNISLDNDGRKVFEAMMSNLFTKHAYGTQTTIGTVEHLKNPSLVKIRNYYNTYYVPNNMAIIMAGDLDPDKTINLIADKFGYMQSKPVPEYVFAPEPVKAAPTVVNVYGPDAENLMIGFRMPGALTREAKYMALCDYMMANSKAGFIDLNLVKKQRVLSASSSTWPNKDYSIYFLSGKPKTGQTLEEVKDLLLAQIELIKKGDFDDATLKAIINNFKVDQIKNNESNAGRAYTMLDAFTVGADWKDNVSFLNDLSKITKQEIVDFANKYFTNEQVIVYKRTGEDKSVVKVPKPEITPVDVNRDDMSPFVRGIVDSKVENIKPVYIDFNKDVIIRNIGADNKVYYVQNKDNGLFSMFYVLDMGKFHNIKLPTAVNLLQYLGTDKYSAEQLSKEFFKIACDFSVFSSDEQVYVSLSGLDENFEAATKLFEHVLANAKPDDAALQQMVERTLKSRIDAKLSKQAVFGALRQYAIFGKNSPSTYLLSSDQLKGLNSAELVEMVKSLTSYKHKIYYYGPRKTDDLVTFLTKEHKMAKKPLTYPAPVVFTRNETVKNTVYFTNYKMVQAEIMWLNKQSLKYDTTIHPYATMFNEYFGGGMSSIVFQTIRESKALAYSTYSRFQLPSKNTDPIYVIAYVGTQADKINDAIPAMNELLTNMPIAEVTYNAAKDALKSQLETERINKEDIIFRMESAKKLGLNHDVRKDVYEALDKMSITDLQRFFDQHYKNKTYNYAIIGSADKVKKEDLQKYGNLVEVSLEDIFGY
ncbi:peptidase M16 [Bacteroidetes bacterium UKL13-3]|nr:peptidase M16 [Bacteroidetes bacterium UKL13-3]HCP93988.1 peptidase M16 [Bacteroidota bacterium]